MKNNPEEKPLLMEEERETPAGASPLIDGLARRQYRGNMFLRVVASAYLWFLLLFGIAFGFGLQILCCVFLWPLFWFRPATKVWLLGWVFRSSVTCTTFFLNPFWRMKRVRTASNIKADGRTLIMCNHTTQADPWVFSRGLFPAEYKWVYKADLLKIPVIAQILRLAHDIPIRFTKDRGGWGTQAGEVQAMMDRVYELGHLYDIGTVVFPEGTRSKTGRLQPFKDGFFKFAVEKQWSIIPCVSHQAPRLWPLGSGLFGYGTVYFSIGEVISPYPGETFDSLKFRVREAMIQLLVEMPEYEPALDEPYPHDIELIVERGQGILGAKV